jgi:DNA repair exonuclease SbcCD ATPase subunit
MLTKECKYLQIELDTIVKEKQNLLNRISYLLKQIHQYECKLAEQKPFDEQYTLLQKQYQIRTDDLQDTIHINQNLKQQLDETKLELSKSRSDLTTMQMKYTNINAEYANLITKYEVCIEELSSGRLRFFDYFSFLNNKQNELKKKKVN